MRVRRRKVIRRLLAVVGIGVLLVAVVSLRLFVWPPSDRPARADAVVALGGDPGQLRARKAVKLAQEGYAPVVVVSLGGTHEAPCPGAEPGIRIICFRADPLDTRGEAEHVAVLAAAHHWTTLIVVPGRAQVTRARLLFERCTRAHLMMVPQSDTRSNLFYQVAYEWGALAKALVVQRSC